MSMAYVRDHQRYPGDHGGWRGRPPGIGRRDSLLLIRSASNDPQ
jgi:hypothetical protein